MLFERVSNVLWFSGQLNTFCWFLEMFILMGFSSLSSILGLCIMFSSLFVTTIVLFSDSMCFSLNCSSIIVTLVSSMSSLSSCQIAKYQSTMMKLARNVFAKEIHSTTVSVASMFISD